MRLWDSLTLKGFKYWSLKSYKLGLKIWQIFIHHIFNFSSDSEASAPTFTPEASGSSFSESEDDDYRPGQAVNLELDLSQYMDNSFATANGSSDDSDLADLHDEDNENDPTDGGEDDETPDDEEEDGDDQDNEEDSSDEFDAAFSDSDWENHFFEP